eukprot:scaffold21438_cov60-Cyclotella_meneghiniana.AAC.5
MEGHGFRANQTKQQKEGRRPTFLHNRRYGPMWRGGAIWVKGLFGRDCSLQGLSKASRTKLIEVNFYPVVRFR